MGAIAVPTLLRATPAGAGTPPSATAAPTTAPATTVSTSAGAPPKGCWQHAIGDPTGSDIAVAVGRSKQGRFGLMFPELPSFAPPDQLLLDLGNQMVEARGPLADVRFSDVVNDTTIPSGYVYLGQFIDHDITRDTTPLTAQQADPHRLLNFDTPCFDLGSVYGRGPLLDPALYDPARPGYLMLVNGDLPRTGDGTAYVGDPRNDENLIIAQLQAVFIRLHNQFMDENQGNFEKARQLTRWHFQWVIVHDFLPRMVGPSLVASLLYRDSKGYIRSSGKLYKPSNPLRPMMPLEYSAAAYRFGHSMIRAEYEVQERVTLPLFSTTNDGQNLAGSRPIPPGMNIDWNYFYEIPGIPDPDDRNFARKIDTFLAQPLSTLPATVVGTSPFTALAQRNLLRGKRLGLPSGQDVANAMGVKPLTNATLGLTDQAWGGKAPLWFYVLKEAELGGGTQLGPVGGRIVAEVILGLLAADRTSYFNAATPWTPPSGSFQMGDLILKAKARADMPISLP